MGVTPLSFEQPAIVCPLLSTREAADLLGVSRATLVRWVDEGRAMPARRMAASNGSYVFTLDEVERLRDTPRPRKPRAPREVAP